MSLTRPLAKLSVITAARQNNLTRKFGGRNREIYFFLCLLLVLFYILFCPLPSLDALNYFSTVPSIILSSSSSSNEDPSPDPTQSQEDQQMTIACDLPQLTSFDPVILEYIKKPDPVDCTIKYPVLFKTEMDLNSVKWRLIKVADFTDFNYTKCCYRTCHHQKATRDDAICSDCVEIKEKQTVLPGGIQMIQVDCDKEDEKGIFVDMFGVVPILTQVEQKVENFHSQFGSTMANGQVNVVIFGIDSLAHMNFQRVMPKSHEFLVKNLSALTMMGYTKVGENTLPNLVPTLMGLSLKEMERTCQTNDTFDECPLIWNYYSNQGYITSYGDEIGYHGLFDAIADGFETIPTDYYFNPVSTELYEHLRHMTIGGDEICVGSHLGFKLVLDYLQDVAQSLQTQFKNTARYFQFMWTMTITHNDLNLGAVGDEPLLQTLQWLQERQYLNNTVLIIMSDHGIWTGGILTTFQGKIERNMPFVYFVIPSWFKKRYPKALKNMIENGRKLTTHFDLHETLIDLANLTSIEDEQIELRTLNLYSNDTKSQEEESGSEEKSNSKWPRGISFFLPIPPERTCDDAGIDSNFCVCRQMTPVDLSQPNKLVEDAAHSVVERINDLLVDYPQCSNLTFDLLMDADVFKTNNEYIEDAVENVNGNWSDPKLREQVVSFRVTVKVQPSQGIFEATASRQTDGNWIISDSISRSDFYGNQSRCVQPKILKSYCFCTD